MSQEGKKSFQEVALKKLQLAVRALPLDRQHIEDYLNIAGLEKSIDFQEAMLGAILAETGALKNQAAPQNTDRLVDLLDTLLQSEMYASDAHQLAQILEGVPEFLMGLNLGTLAKHAAEVLADLRGRKYTGIPNFNHP